VTTRSTTARGSNGVSHAGDRARHKGVIESYFAILQFAWIEKPWKDKGQLVCDSGRDLSFDEMVLFLADLMNTHPLVDPTTEALGGLPDGGSAPQCESEVARG
jgi:hypothetical protein